MTDTTTHVFLSYAGEEATFVRAVADELGRRGVETWFDEARLEPGDSFVEGLGKALDSASAVIIFVSTATLRSSWANFEIGAALGRNKHVLPVYLTELARRDAPSFLATAEGIDAYDLKPDEVAQRIAAVAKRW
jgi:hypothetical protein